MGTQHIKLVLICVSTALLVPDVKGTIPAENQNAREIVGCSRDDLAVTCDNASQIAIISFKYGFKPVNLSCPENATNNDSCCSYAADDCLQDAPTNDSMYIDALSGRRNTSIPTPSMLPTPVGKCDDNLTYADEPVLSLLEYICIPEERIHGHCGYLRNQTDTLPLYIRNGNYPNWGGGTCNCSIDVPYDTNITMYVIHLDMYNGTASCLQNITMEGADGSMVTFGCETPQFNVIQNMTIPESYIVVKVPNIGKFWLGFQASMNGSRAVLNCPARPPLDCQSPPSLEYGHYTTTSTRYGGEAHYQCDLGYEMTSGNDVISCGIDGSWKGTAPTCTNAGVVPYGETVKHTTECYGSNLSAVCTNGKIAVSSFASGFKSSSARCPVDGTANGSCCTYNNNTDCLQEAAAEPRYVDALSGRESGVISTSSVTAGGQCNSDSFSAASVFSTLEYICLEDDRIKTMCDSVSYSSTHNLPSYLLNRNYPDGILNTDMSCTCSVEISEFTAIDMYILHLDLYGTPEQCKQNITISDGVGAVLMVFQCETHPYNTILKKTLNSTYLTITMKNSGTTTNAGKFWFGFQDSNRNASLTIDCPSKQQKFFLGCGDLSAPEGGTVNVTSTSYAGVATYTCDPGYARVAGDAIRTCQANNTWSGQPITCSTVNENGTVVCEIPAGPDNGKVDAPNNTLGGVATYTCNQKYKNISGDITRVCQINGKWSGEMLVCGPKDCGNLENITNGMVSIPGTTVGSTATYSCMMGYTVVTGSETRVCQEDETWSGNPPTCGIVDCEQPPSITNADVNFETTTYGSMATYTCRDSYVLDGNRDINCQAHGSWSEPQPTCAFVCNEMDDPENGQVSLSANPPKKNDIATFTCNPNFTINGSDSIKCIESTGWSPDPPFCSKKQEKDTSDTDEKGNEKESVLVPVLVTILIVILLAVVIGGIWYKKKGNGYFKFGNKNGKSGKDEEHMENSDDMKDAEKGDNFELDGFHGVELDNTSVDEEEARKENRPSSSTVNASANTADETKKNSEESKAVASPSDVKVDVEPEKATDDETDPEKDTDDKTKSIEEGKSANDENNKLSASDGKKGDKLDAENTKDTAENDTDIKDKMADDEMNDKQMDENKDVKTNGEPESTQNGTAQNENESDVFFSSFKSISKSESEVSSKNVITENGEKKESTE